jgi:hypothetical protein
MAEQLKNFGVTTLSSSVTSGALSIPVANGALLSSSGTFRIKVDSELMLVDSRSGNTLTINASGRGAEGTTAASHSSGATVRQVITAASLVAIISENQHTRLHDVESTLDHSYAGLVAGQVLSADSATAASFQQLMHDELGNILSDDHHDGDHTILSHMGSFTPTSSIIVSILQSDDSVPAIPYALTATMATMGSFTIAAGEAWLIELILFLSATGDAQDIRAQWSLPANVGHRTFQSAGIQDTAADAQGGGTTEFSDYRTWTTSTKDYGIDSAAAHGLRLTSKVTSTTGAGTCSFQVRSATATGGTVDDFAIMARRII